MARTEPDTLRPAHLRRSATLQPTVSVTPMHRSQLVTDQQRESFHRDGFLLLREFHDVARDVEPIQRGIYEIIGMLARKHGLHEGRPAFSPETFDAGHRALNELDRRVGGEIYDAVKHLPPFLRLVCNERYDRVFSELWDTDLCGVATSGYGIRIDNPGEERFRADWHQEYHVHPRSMHGVVFWTPLMPVDEELGGPRVCVGSHADGLVPVHLADAQHPEKTGPYGWILSDRDARIAGYDLVAPPIDPCDLLVIDFLVLHSSGHNVSERARWSIQSRYFDFREPTGVENSWHGPIRDAAQLSATYPNLVDGAENPR